jgi:hypothetical protein
MNFFYKAILDDINLAHVKMIKFSIMRIDSYQSNQNLGTDNKEEKEE